MFDKFPKQIISISFLLSSIALVSCGSGGSSDTGTTSNPPVAVDDNFSVDKGQTLEVVNPLPDGILANDSDPNNDPLQVVLVSKVKFGILALNPDGSFSYTPDKDSSSSVDSFTYRAKNASSVSGIATVSIVINNHDPVVSSNCLMTPQDVAISGTLQATSVDGTSLTYKLGVDGSDGSGPINTAHGTVEITDPTTGAYTYTPSPSGARGSDSFKFFVEDTDGGSATATETIVVDQKIMPLGDSITRGTGDGSSNDNQKVGYRKPLYDSLNNAGYSFDFVGSDAKTGGSVANFDSDNEGHGGWTTTEIAFGQVGFPSDGVRAWLDKNPADIILLHIGTNDGPVAGTESNTELILNEIDAWENSSKGNPVTVILAKIVNQDMSYAKSIDVRGYNAELVSMALARITDNIVIVDMEAPLSYPADLADRVHPNKNGYKKMASVWHKELTSLLDKCP